MRWRSRICTLVSTSTYWHRVMGSSRIAIMPQLTGTKQTTRRIRLQVRSAVHVVGLLLRHACERVVQTAGATACHPGYADADYMLDDVYDRDLDNGYHEKGSCVDDDGVDDTGCVIHDLFGGFGDRAAAG